MGRQEYEGDIIPELSKHHRTQEDIEYAAPCEAVHELEVLLDEELNQSRGYFSLSFCYLQYVLV